MCPFCLSTAAIVAISAASGGTGAFFVMRKRSSKKDYQSTPETVTTTQRRKAMSKAQKAHSQTVSHQVASREEWLAARIKLLKEEKELTRHGDEVARQRQALPWVQLDKDYRFDTDEGNVSLADLFKGRSQLLVYHFMFGPDWAAGCPSCSSIADGFNGITTHLANHDVMLWAVSRAPITKLQAYKKRMGWTFPWASSSDCDFNFDYKVSFTEEQQRKGDIDYNFRSDDSVMLAGIGQAQNAVTSANSVVTGTNLSTYTRDRENMSAFVLEDGVIYHTYSAYARGVDAIWGMYPWLDRAPKGRNETGYWLRRHDEYQGN